MGMLGTLTDREYNKFTTSADGNPVVKVTDLGKLVPENYDYIEIGYSGSDITSVTYKVGGSGGTTVATLNLGYTGDNLTSIEKV